MTVSRILPRLLFAAAFVGLAVGFAAFDSFPPPSEAEIRGVSAAVVFTGAFERVDLGLRLLNEGAVQRLYISGVNENAGILPAGFVAQFAARNTNIEKLRSLVNCCVEWGERAENTFQNALDTQCWVRRRGLSGNLLLVTSRRHMARALTALAAALPGRRIVPYAVEDADAPNEPLKARTLEYLKYLGAILAARLPWIAHAPQLAGPFAQGCPETL